MMKTFKYIFLSFWIAFVFYELQNDAYAKKINVEGLSWGFRPRQAGRTLLIHKPLILHTKRKVLKPNENGIVFYKDIPCQNSSFTFKDITFQIMSSTNTYHQRIPIIDKAWVIEAQLRGARVIITAGMDLKVQDPRIVYIQQENNGGCGAPPMNHCDDITHEHAKMLSEQVKTKLIVYCDDDTVFNLDTYIETVRCLPKKELWALGDCQKAHWERRSFCGGGASITFQTSMLPLFVTCTSGGGRADDVQASWCAMDAGASLIHHPTFRYSFDYCPTQGYEWVSVHHIFRDPQLCKENRPSMHNSLPA